MESIELAFVWQNLQGPSFRDMSKLLKTEIYEGKSLNNRNFILKCMENYAKRKTLYRDTKLLLSYMTYSGRDDRVV